MKRNAIKFYFTYLLPPIILLFLLLSYLVIYYDEKIIYEKELKNFKIECDSFVNVLTESNSLLSTLSSVASSLYEMNPSEISNYLTEKYFEKNYTFYVVDTTGNIFFRTNNESNERKVSNKTLSLLHTLDEASYKINVFEQTNDENNLYYLSPLFSSTNETIGFFISYMNLEKIVNPYLISKEKIAFYTDDDKFLYGNDLIQTETYNNKTLLSLRRANGLQAVKLIEKHSLGRKLYLSVLTFTFSFAFMNGFYFIGKQRHIKKKMVEEQRKFNNKKLDTLRMLTSDTTKLLNNPLNNLTDLLADIEIKTADKELLIYISIIKNELQRINEISSQFSQIEKPMYSEKKIIALQTIIKKIIPLLQYEAYNKNIRLETDIEKNLIYIHANLNEMIQAFINLVQNAIDATKKNGKISIKVRREKTQASIYIKDNGCGIPEEHLNKVFDAFYSTKSSGTGLGLRITLQIIESHFGSLSITSKVKKGTTVKITLPIYC